MNRREVNEAMAAAIAYARFARDIPRARAASIQTLPPSIADGIGVNLRVGDMSPAALDAARDMGFRWLRTDVRWAQLEPQPGTFDFSPVREPFRRARERGFRLLGIFDYGHPIYTQGRGPATPDERARFVAFVQAAENAIGDLADAWEIWNEPNLHGFWLPTPDPLAYSALLEDAAAGIWAVKPDRQVIAAGLSTVDTAFLTAIGPTLVSLAAQGRIAASVHPYRGPNPETLVGELRGAGLIDGSGRAATRDGIPLWVSEWGYKRGLATSGPSDQSEMQLRIPLVTASLGVPVTIVFELIDAQPRPTRPQDTYGFLASGSLQPWPAADAYRSFLRQFGALSVTSLGLLQRNGAWGLQTNGGTLWWQQSSSPGGALPAAAATPAGGLKVADTTIWLERSPQ